MRSVGGTGDAGDGAPLPPTCYVPVIFVWNSAKNILQLLEAKAREYSPNYTWPKLHLTATQAKSSFWTVICHNFSLFQSSNDIFTWK